MKNIFTFKKFTKFVLEKYPLFQLECNKWNYTNIYFSWPFLKISKNALILEKK